MRCPRCGSDNERDVSKTPCSRCGLLVRMPDRSTGIHRTNSPRAITPKLPVSSNNPFLIRLPDMQQDRPDSEEKRFTSENPFSRTFLPRNTVTGTYSVPHRPHPRSHASEAEEDGLVEMERAAHSLHFYPSEQFTRDAVVQGKQAFSFISSSLEDTTLQDGIMLARPSSHLVPGMILRGGRYRLLEYKDSQEWLNGAYEATWIAQDAQRAGMRVVICELAIPESIVLPVQTMLRQATIALTSIGRFHHVPTLWDAFSDLGENFFVFEPVQGETLLEGMRRTGRAFPEQRIIEMSLQILNVLSSASQQVPPLVHGLIRPEHIKVSSDGSHYTLTNFSIVLAGGAISLVKGLDITQSSPFFSTEFIEGEIDERSDMYALVATMYHTVTGSLPEKIDGVIPEAQRLNPLISSRMNALLAKGLHVQAERRFQTISELQQAIMALRRSYVGPFITEASAYIALQDELLPEKTQKPLLSQQALSKMSEDDKGKAEKQQKLLPLKLDEIALDDGRSANRFTLALIISIVVCLLVVLLALWRFLLY